MCLNKVDVAYQAFYSSYEMLIERFVFIKSFLSDMFAIVTIQTSLQIPCVGLNWQCDHHSKRRSILILNGQDNIQDGKIIYLLDQY